VPRAGLGLRWLAVGALCLDLCSCASAQWVVVTSNPRGARIVLNGSDTLARTPVRVRIRRAAGGSSDLPFMVEAVPADSTQCPQVELVERGAPTPDTLRFSMDLCPPPGLDLSLIFDTSAVTIRPSRVSSPPVRYPDELRARGIQGRVMLELVIDTTGRVEPGSIRVVAATHRAFGGAAAQMVANSRFWPARIAGRKVRVRVQLPVNFRIQVGGTETTPNFR